MSTLSRQEPFSTVLGESEGKVARALVGGQSVSIAKTVLGIGCLKAAIIAQLLGVLNDECRQLCRKSDTASPPFRKIHVDKMCEFTWKAMTAELQAKAPLLYKILYSVTSRNDYRNVVKTGAAHFPGICFAAAILLKERNREMCGLQSMVSLVMYNCHCEKQVHIQHTPSLNGTTTCSI